MNNRSLGQYGRHAKAELHDMAVGAMRKVDEILRPPPTVVIVPRWGGTSVMKTITVRNLKITSGSNAGIWIGGVQNEVVACGGSG